MSCLVAVWFDSGFERRWGWFAVLLFSGLAWILGLHSRGLRVGRAVAWWWLLGLRLLCCRRLCSLVLRCLWVLFGIAGWM